MLLFCNGLTCNASASHHASTHVYRLACMLNGHLSCIASNHSCCLTLFVFAKLALVVGAAWPHLLAGDAKQESSSSSKRENMTPAAYVVQQIIGGTILASFAAYSFTRGRPDVQEISFHHFKSNLLGQGLVERLEVTNKTSVKVRFAMATASLCNPAFDRSPHNLLRRM